MNMQNSGSQDNLKTVLEIIREITEKSAQGNYIYRGEPQHYDKVSSNLYRQYKDDIEAEYFEIEVAQSEMLKEAKDYIHETNEEFEILTQLQHFGGKTNLIDFTTDYLVALFFACDGFFEEPGRVILLGEEAQRENQVEKPRNVINRVRDQKSVLARPPRGFIEIERDNTINIPKCLKQSILDYLEKYHDISTKTIYNDLHGFIRVQDLHQSAYTEFFKGLTCQNRSQHDRAIEHYTEAIDLKPDYTEAYTNRGVAYAEKGDFDRSIEDHNTAIQLKPDFVEAYTNRGAAYSKQGDYDCAIADYDKAIELKPDFEAYYNRGIAYIKKGNFDRAIVGDAKSIEPKRDLVEAYNNRGKANSEEGEIDRAIEDFAKVIDLESDFVNAYNNRGMAYCRKGDFDRAIEDFDKAIQLQPGFAIVYNNRGEAWLHLKGWDKARADLTAARDMGLDIIASFHNDYVSISDFEDRNGIKLPADIAAMLTPQQ